MMKKTNYIILTLIQIIFFIGMYILDYFTRKKLGMNRWVVYHSMKLDNNTIIQVFKYILPILVLIFTVYFIKKYYSAFKKAKFKIIDFIILILLTVILMCVLIICSTKSIKLYYFYIAIVMCIYLIQLIKLHISFKATSNNI